MTVLSTQKGVSALERPDRLAEERASLGRVAKLVAQGTPPAGVFAAVVDEAAQLLRVEIVSLIRFEADDTATVVGAAAGRPFSVGTNLAMDRPSVTALVTGAGVATAFACPITVDGRAWGSIVAVPSGETISPDGEDRLSAFTDLVAPAIGNAEAKAELMASRARIVATADATRRRIERDLHDGVQQQLASLNLQLRAAQADVPDELGELAAELDAVATGLTNALHEIRDYGRGIHPAILTEGGLGPALKTLARRSAVRIKLNVGADGRLHEPVEVAAYYAVSEALANATKHAHASRVAVDIASVGNVLHVAVRDDGVGGANFRRGSGLVGLKDRVESLGGRISVKSPCGAGTSISVELPLAGGSGTGRLLGEQRASHV